MEINRNVLLPNLVTVGNGVCGFWALMHLYKARWIGPGLLDFEPATVFPTAAWLVLLGMVFDVFDGKVARLSGGASALGAQLDSFCDLVTFGLVPAVMMLQASAGCAPQWQRVVWFLALAYFLCAMFRLARFTAENEPDDTAHVAFKGLPSPGAAGCVASLIILAWYLAAGSSTELVWLEHLVEPAFLKTLAAWIVRLLPLLGVLLGLAMVSSRLKFDHIGSLFLSKKHSFDSYIYILFGVILLALVPEVLFPLLFLGYLTFTPVSLLYRKVARGAARTASDDASRS